MFLKPKDIKGPWLTPCHALRRLVSVIEHNSPRDQLAPYKTLARLHILYIVARPSSYQVVSPLEPCMHPSLVSSRLAGIMMIA